MTGAQLAYLILSFAFGGGLVSLIKAIGENRKASADAAAIEQRAGSEVANLSVNTLSQVVRTLREDNEVLRGERDHYRERLADMENVVQRLRDELEQVQIELQAMLNAGSSA